MFNYQQNPNMVGYTAANRPQPRFTQPVTNEMSKMVLSTDDELSVKISPTEKIKNMCTHKDPGTGQVALVDDGKDSKGRDIVTCRVCGESFHMVMNPDAEVFDAVEKVRDILQSAKTLYLDIPEEFAKEYFQILTLLDRTPQLFRKAAKNFNQYYDYSNNPNPVWGNMNSFAQVNGMIGGMNMGGIQPGFYGYANPAFVQTAPMGQQPIYQQPVNTTPTAPVAGQPVQYQYNAYGQPIAAAPVASNDNPLMYTPAAPVAQPVAPAPAPGVAPGATTIPVQGAPAAPTQQTGEITQVKSFSV